MSDKTELELDGGFKLTHMVQAQRGLSDLEIEIFLATGQKPDLSQPPLEYADETPDDAQIMSEEDAEAWLSGAPLTASSFYDFNSSHSVSPLYEEVMRPKVRAFDFDPNQPRDEDGKWTDGFPGKGAVGILEKAVKKTVASTKKATPAVIYKKHDDGTVVGHTKDGKRMRWDAGRKKFIVEKPKGNGWEEESAHTKTTAYNDMKNPDKWFEPTENGTENGPSETSQKPEPDLADTDTTAETPELPAETVKSGDVEVDTSPTVETPDTGGDVKIAGPDILLHDGESVFTNTKGASSFYTYPGTKPYTPEWSARNDYVDEEVSVPLNRKLRNGKPLSPNQQKVADVMDDTIAKYQTEYEADVFRAVRISDDLLDSWTTPGSTITDPAFMSTATSRAMAERSLQTNSGNAAMMKIRLPKGTNAAPGLVDTHNNDDGAGELVLGRNTTLQIVDAKKNNGIWEISANVVPKTSNTDENVDAVPPEVDVTPTPTPAELGMPAADAQAFISDWGKKIGLTDDDRKTLDDWASPDMSAMRGMQTHLQNGGELTSDEVALRDKLDNLAERGKLPEAVKAYRVVKPWDDIKGDVDGKTITERGFQSASLQPKDVIGMWGAAYAAAGQDPVIFEMNIPKDTPAFTPEWNKSSFAHELTLGRDVDMKITGTREETMFVPGLGKEHTFKVLTMDITPREREAAPEIPKQADASAIENDTPGVYTGPTAETYGGAPKDVTDKARKTLVASIGHEHRVEALADELRKDKTKYDGWDAWDKSIKDARAQLASEAPPDSDLDGALDELHAALPDYTTYDQVYRRLGLEAGVEVRMAKFTEKNGLGALTPEVKADLTKRMKEAFTGKKVAVRVSPKTVEHILNDGRIKSQFETNKSSGKKDFGVRTSIERALFGITDKPHQNAEKRPIYGYVAMDGIRPAGIGSAQLGDPSTDALSQYGQVQVVLKDSVRDRTTAMFGDSMNNMSEAIPTPINNPDWRSFQASRGGITGKGLMGLDRSGENQEFRAGAYAEAQIHDGVSVDDIEEIVFPSNPTATVKAQLETAGIPYRVLSFKTAADGSDEERAAALRIAKQDKPFLEAEIKKLQDKIPTLVDKSYAQKDLAKYEKQLKTINDALPLLEGTKTSPAKKVAAAKAKVAKATAPKQADAPKIESTGGTKLSEAEEKELTALRNQISDLYGQSGYWRMREAEITHKGNGGILTPEDLKESEQAYKELKKLQDNATPLAERELELRMKRDGDLFGEVDDPNAERWAAKNKPAAIMLPGNDPAKIEKIADSYRVNDKATTEHNMSLRSGEPTQAAVAWRSRMKRMINSQKLDKDSVVYRGAALTPERIMQLRPGAVMIDPGSMSTDESRGSAEFYMKTRLGDLPGTLGTVFEIRAPKGMPAADVEYGEFVFDFHTPMRIISTKRENGIVNVVAELVPPDEAKALYGAPPVPKAAKPSGVDLGKGKRGSINAKEAKRYQEDFAKAGLHPWSSPQEIFDKAKSKAYYNDRSVMQILEAIDAMKPGYKKTVLDWLKTPEGIDYASKKSTS